VAEPTLAGVHVADLVASVLRESRPATGRATKAGRAATGCNQFSMP
jgi:hypothetical protein